MVIQDLPAQTAVKLQIDWDGKQLELDSEVVGSNPNGVLIRPYMHNGQTIDIPEKKRKDMAFHLFAVDDKGNRVGWRNISVTSCQYQGRSYYVCNTSSFQKDAKDEDRRSHARTPLGVPGLVEFRDGSYIEVTVKDISDNGIAFLVPTDYELPTPEGTVSFNDSVRNSVFSVQLRFQKVRSQLLEDCKLIGATIKSISQQDLTYIFMKRMEERSTDN